MLLFCNIFYWYNSHFHLLIPLDSTSPMVSGYFPTLHTLLLILFVVYCLIFFIHTLVQSGGAGIIFVFLLQYPVHSSFAGIILAYFLSYPLHSAGAGIILACFLSYPVHPDIDIGMTAYFLEQYPKSRFAKGIIQIFSLIYPLFHFRLGRNHKFYPPYP